MTFSMFPSNTLARWLLVLVLLAGLYFLSGFLVPALAALVVGLASWPLYRRWRRLCGGHDMLASATAIIIAILVLVVPLSMALLYAVREASAFIAWLIMVNRHGVAPPDWLAALPVVGPRAVEYWENYLGAPQLLGDWVQAVSGEHLGNIYQFALTATGRVVHVVLALLILLITLFFIYRDGQRLLGQLDAIGERVLGERWLRFSRVVPATVSATVTGMGLIALGEGLVLGLAYWVAGVPSPALLGVLTAVMALVPGGAPLSFTLASLYLLGSGHTTAGIALFAWGSIELFIVDKALRPRLVGGPVKMPFLPTFFGLVGGVQTLGIVGLFVGPVLMALWVAIWREWVGESTRVVPPALPEKSSS